ncbi:MAG: NTP transferase domain-containing protein [Acidimicrobiia bacterium]|nr:NTP transferase domain-containing protein [Acidimicrobiia bacterium]
MSSSLVVMAAGRGSRFGGMKQVAGLGPSDESLFDFAVYDAIKSGFDDAVFVVSEESREAVEKHVAAGLGRHVDVRYALQAAGDRPKPWGTGQAVLCACAEVGGPFGVINADDFYGRRSYELLAEELARDSEHHVAIGFRLRDTLSTHGGVSRGLCVVEDGFLTDIQELHDVQVEGDGVRSDEIPELSGDEPVSVNLWGFRPSFCEVLGAEFERFRKRVGDDPKAEFLIGDAIDALPAHGAARVAVVPTPERFLGVTYQDDVEGVRNELARLVDEGVYPSPLWG